MLVRDKTFVPSDDLVRHLRTARSAASSMATWKAGGVAAAGFGVIATLLLTGVAMIASPPTFAVLMGALIAVLPFVFGAVAWRSAVARKVELDTELDNAWLEAARALAASRGTVTAAQLGEALGLDNAASRQLVSRLGASSEVTTDVTESGDLALSIRVPEKLRVDTGADDKPENAAAVEQAEASESSDKSKARE